MIRKEVLGIFFTCKSECVGTTVSSLELANSSLGYSSSAVPWFAVKRRTQAVTVLQNTEAEEWLQPFKRGD